MESQSVNTVPEPPDTHMNPEPTTVDARTVNESKPVKKRWRRAFVASSILLSLVISVVLAFPVVLRKTSLRDNLLNSSLAKSGLSGTSKSVTGGWMTPITLHSITINDPSGNFTLKIPKLRSSRTLAQILAAGGDYGRVVVENAFLRVSVDDEGNWPLARQSSSQISALEFEIKNFTFVLGAPWRSEPIISLTNLDVTGRIRQVESGQRQLIVDECLLVNRQPMSGIGAGSNLALIAPILSQSTHITGTASVRLGQTVIPMEPTADGRLEVQLSGEAEFHSLDARLKEDWIEQLATLIGTATQVDIPNRIVVARDSVVRFQVFPDGVHHDAMAFLLPDLAPGLVAETSGTIGLDESLDLDLAIQLPQNLQPSDPFVAQFIRLLNGPLRARVTGTIDIPELQFPSTSEMLSDLSKRINTTSHQDEAPDVPRAVFDLIRGVSQTETDPEGKATDIAGGIIGLIRSIDASTKNAPETDDDATNRKD
jgi:hypothetical protein